MSELSGEGTNRKKVKRHGIGEQPQGVPDELWKRARIYPEDKSNNEAIRKAIKVMKGLQPVVKRGVKEPEWLKRSRRTNTGKVLSTSS